jgi:rhodanese-related sulfurtransferase
VDFFVFISEQWVLVSILMVLIYLLAISEGLKGGKQIGISEAVAMINADKGVVLDVRDKKEFDGGHIHGAIGIPFASLKSRKVELDKCKSKTIIIVDKLGTQGGNVGKQLRGDGFDVCRLKGGVSEWQSQNLPLVTGKA